MPDPTEQWEAIVAAADDDPIKLRAVAEATAATDEYACQLADRGQRLDDPIRRARYAVRSYRWHLQRITDPPRVRVCTACRRRVAVTIRDVLRVHGTPARRCPGGGSSGDLQTEEVLITDQATTPLSTQETP